MCDFHPSFQQAHASKIAAVKVNCRCAMEFAAVTYNVFSRPTVLSPDGQAERLAAIPSALASHTRLRSADTITLCEAFSGPHRTQLIGALKEQGWVHATDVVGGGGLSMFLNGGVLIVSKWPIDRQAQRVFSACAGSDCLASKGVVYARINKQGQCFHVLGMHLQAWGGETRDGVRVAQATEAAAFVQELGIPADEPVLYCGDLNVDAGSSPVQVQAVLDALSATCPDVQGTHQYTSDPMSNSLVGRDGAAEHWGCATEYTSAFTPDDVLAGHHAYQLRAPASQRACTKCPREFLDYVLWSSAHKRPASASLTVVPLTSNAPLVYPWARVLGMPTLWVQSRELSDHYPVVGTFVFDTRAAASTAASTATLTNGRVAGGAARAARASGSAERKAGSAETIAVPHSNSSLSARGIATCGKRNVRSNKCLHNLPAGGSVKDTRNMKQCLLCGKMRVQPK